MSLFLLFIVLQMFYLLSLNCGVSYMDSTNWVKNIKAAVNPKNRGDKCFQYAVLNHKEIGKHPQRTWKIEPFIY